MSYECLLRMKIVGDAGIGKSSLLLKYSKDIFDGRYISSIGKDFYLKDKEIRGKKYRIQIFDSYSSDPFSLSINFDQPIDVALHLAAFDVTDSVSFSNIKAWINKMDYLHPNHPVILVGCKTDLSTKRVVSAMDAREYAESHGISFIDTSASNGFNVEECFDKAASLLLDKSGILNIEAPSSSIALETNIKVEAPSSSLALETNIKASTVKEEHLALRELIRKYDNKFWKDGDKTEKELKQLSSNLNTFFQKSQPHSKMMTKEDYKELSGYIQTTIDNIHSDYVNGFFGRRGIGSNSLERLLQGFINDLAARNCIDMPVAREKNIATSYRF